MKFSIEKTVKASFLLGTFLSNSGFAALVEAQPPHLIPEPDKLVQCYRPHESRWNRWSFTVWRNATAQFVQVKKEKYPRVELDVRVVLHECLKNEWDEYVWTATPWPEYDRLYVNSYENYKDSAFDDADIANPDALGEIFRSQWFLDAYVWLKGPFSVPFAGEKDSYRTKIQIPVREALTRKDYASFKIDGIAKLDLILGLSSKSVEDAYRFNRLRGGFTVIDSHWLSGTYRAQVELNLKDMTPKAVAFVNKKTIIIDF